jgi:uncharacterized alkaline shock family protein YloU
MSETPATAKTVMGRVDITEGAITALVRDAVRSCYGVVGIGKPSRNRVISRLPSPWKREAIKVTVTNSHISVLVPIVVEYGTPIDTVARNVIRSVTFQLRRSLGMPVERVDVQVTGLRVTSPELSK